jgi:hypothetical protein
MDKVKINGYSYTYYKPDSYEGTKLYKKQIKRVKEKIKASQSGCYEGKMSTKGKPLYQDYSALLEFLEGLVKKIE